MDSLATLLEALPFQVFQQAFLALDLIVRSALLLLLFNWFIKKQRQPLSAASEHHALLILLACLSLIPFLPNLPLHLLGQDHELTLLSILLPSSTSWSNTTSLKSAPPVSSLAVIYFPGVLLLAIRLALSLLRITVLRHRANYCIEHSNAQLLQQCKRNLDIDKTIRLGLSPTLRSPVSFGWRRPVILVPVAWQQWNNDLRLSVLQHETAHIKRHDWLLSLVSELIAVLHWFNPIVWHVKQRMEFSSEQACDALSVQYGSDQFTYAEHLLWLARSCSTRASRLGLSNPIVQVGNMSGRIEAILSGSNRQRLMSRLQVLLLCAVLFIAALTPVRIIAVEDARLFRTPLLLNTAKPIYNPQEIWTSLPAHIRVRYDIDASGKVDTESIRVITSPGHASLSPAIIEAVKQFEYAPRLVRGAPVPARNLEWSLMIRGQQALYRPSVAMRSN